MIETFVDMRAWFRERLEDALGRQRLEASEETRAYLVELLAALGVGRRTPGEVPLATQLLDAHSIAGPERLARYRTIGDEALCLSGFFPDHLERRGLSPSYVATMGGGAYESARVLAMRDANEAARIEAYHELARKFARFALALDDVREHTAMRTPQDIVKMYDKWRRTGSKVIAERLSEAGVLSMSGDPDPTIH